jgi:hypothetical protein
VSVLMILKNETMHFSKICFIRRSIMNRGIGVADLFLGVFRGLFYIIACMAAFFIGFMSPSKKRYL